MFVHSTVTAEIIHALPGLKLISARSTGTDHIDVAAAAEQGVTVCNVPSYGENTVAEHAFALLLAVSRKIVAGVERVRSGSFSTEGLMGFDLRGKTLGVIGTGRIGKHMLKMASGFEMNLVAYDLYPDNEMAEQLSVIYLSLEELVRTADIISLHVSLQGNDEHFLNRALLEMCKPSLVLINTARGGLVDTAALVELLKSGHIAGAGLDVLEDEGQLVEGGYSPETQELLGLPNVIVTPHMALDSKEAVQRIRNTSAENIQGYFAGEVKNIVSR